MGVRNAEQETLRRLDSKTLDVSPRYPYGTRYV